MKEKDREVYDISAVELNEHNLLVNLSSSTALSGAVGVNKLNGSMKTMVQRVGNQIFTLLEVR